MEGEELCITCWLHDWSHDRVFPKKLDHVFTSAPLWDWTSMAHRGSQPLPSCTTAMGIKVQLIFPLFNDFRFIYEVADSCKMHSSVRNRIGNHDGNTHNLAQVQFLSWYNSCVTARHNLACSGLETLELLAIWFKDWQLLSFAIMVTQWTQSPILTEYYNDMMIKPK